jgi:AcrR family transcriptional regulator
MAKRTGPRKAYATRGASEARVVSTPIALAEGELRGMRHVCGLFSGVEETYAVLLPFIAAGLEQGQRAVHFVAPAARASHLERLASAGLDVEGALDTGQLAVTTWEVSYLRSARFDPVGTLLFLEKTLAEGRSRGFAVTRLIGFMEWALEEVPGVGDVITYETDLDLALRGRPDPVVCAYDLSRQATSVIARLQATHPLAVIDGKLLATAAGTTSPRERVLDAASWLFSSRGVGATGVDALIDAAGVAKRTFYRYFPSKDDLIVAWLSDDRTRWLDRVRGRAEEIANGPDEVIPAFFDAVAEWLEANGCRGCPYLNTAVELIHPSHPAHRVIDGFLSDELAYLTDAVRSTARGASIADGELAPVALQLQTLLAGAISLSVASRDPLPAREARDAAIRLLDRGAGRSREIAL